MNSDLSPAEHLAQSIRKAASELRAFPMADWPLADLHQVMDEAAERLGQLMIERHEAGALPQVISEVIAPIVSDRRLADAARCRAVFAQAGNHVMPFESEQIVVDPQAFARGDAYREWARTKRRASVRDEHADRMERLAEWLHRECVEGEEAKGEGSGNESAAEAWERAIGLLSRMPESKAIAEQLRGRRHPIAKDDLLANRDAFPNESYASGSVKKKVRRINEKWQSARPRAPFYIGGDERVGFMLEEKKLA